jgi:hypothetical protein
LSPCLQEHMIVVDMVHDVDSRDIKSAHHMSVLSQSKIQREC